MARTLVHKLFIEALIIILLEKGRLTLVSFSVTMQCPTHGFEHFRVKIIKRVNISSDRIMPKVRNRPKPGEISCLYVGRNVSYEKAKSYLLDYYREKGLGEIVRVKMIL